MLENARNFMQSVNGISVRVRARSMEFSRKHTIMPSVSVLFHRLLLRCVHTEISRDQWKFLCPLYKRMQFSVEKSDENLQAKNSNQSKTKPKTSNKAFERNSLNATSNTNLRQNNLNFKQPLKTLQYNTETRLKLYIFKYLSLFDL